MQLSVCVEETGSEKNEGGGWKVGVTRFTRTRQGCPDAFYIFFLYDEVPFLWFILQIGPPNSLNRIFLKQRIKRICVILDPIRNARNETG